MRHQQLDHQHLPIQVDIRFTNSPHRVQLHSNGKDMAHFAQLDYNNIVVQVIVINDNDCKDSAGNESEEVGAEFCQKLLGGRWIQTSYNHNIRKNFAGIGYTYYQDIDAFLPPQPFPSWSIGKTTCSWTAPIPYPSDGNNYDWDESTLSWKSVPKGLNT